MKKVKIIKDHLTFKKGKTANVTDRTAEKFVKDGIAEFEKKEEKAAIETKQEKKAPKTTKSPK